MPLNSKLTDDEKKAISSLQTMGFKFEEMHNASLLFQRSRAGYPDEPRTFGARAIPRENVPELIKQLSEPIVDHPTFTGFTISAHGYIELLLRSSRPAGLQAERVFRLIDGPSECCHAADENKLPSLEFVSRPGGTPAVRRVHISGQEKDPCLEISNASPIGALYYGRYTFSGRLTPTIKIAFPGPVDHRTLISRSNDLVRSFLYELDVRNGIALSVEGRTLPRQSTILDRRALTRIEKLRFPKIQVTEEISSLFSFASQAMDNPPLAFLSYYQTLEYFIPAAVRQTALRRIRQELNDPTFDETSDKSILKIIATTERTTDLAEPNQFRALVREYVRLDRLEEFFGYDWGDYFTKKGPIHGVENINTNNQNKELADQVADRIYKIRNRIVHAKDDPRYGDARVLLPRSLEAQALRPDVLLARLLATEAISNSQV